MSIWSSDYQFLKEFVKTVSVSHAFWGEPGEGGDLKPGWSLSSPSWLSLAWVVQMWAGCLGTGLSGWHSHYCRTAPWGRRGHLFNPAGWVCPVSCNYRLGLDPTGINTNSKMKSKVTKSNKTMKSIDKNGLLFQIDWTAVQTTDAFLFMLKLALIFTNYFAQTLHCHFHKSFVRW